jgi:hypothetical protein
VQGAHHCCSLPVLNLLAIALPIAVIVIMLAVVVVELGGDG